MNIFSLSGNHILLKELLLSIPDHICNIHVFPGNIFYKDCGHTPLPGERPKAWLDVDSLVKKIKMLSEISFYTKKAVRKIRAAIVGKDNCRLDDLPHMLGFTHTGSIGKFNFALTKK